MHTTKEERKYWKPQFDGFPRGSAPDFTERLLRDVDELKDTLQEAWLDSHSKNCNSQWPHGGQCYWERPVILWTEAQDLEL